MYLTHSADGSCGSFRGLHTSRWTASPFGLYSQQSLQRHARSGNSAVSKSQEFPHYSQRLKKTRNTKLQRVGKRHVTLLIPTRSVCFGGGLRACWGSPSSRSRSLGFARNFRDQVLVILSDIAVGAHWPLVSYKRDSEIMAICPWCVSRKDALNDLNDPASLKSFR